GETEAAAAAGTGRTRHAAATRDAIGIDVQPDDVAHALLGDRLRHARPLHELGQALGLGRRRPRLEPREQGIDELRVRHHPETGAPGGYLLADATHEVRFRLVAEVIALRHDDDA